MKPRIAILTNYPADFLSFSGGVETATAALLEGLSEYQREFKFHVVSSPKGLSRDIHTEHRGFHFHFLSTPSMLMARPRLLFRISRGLLELRAISPDLVHCQDNMAFALAAILSGCPRIFTIHGVKIHEASKRDGWERWSTGVDALIERYVHRNFKSFIYISDYARRLIRNGGLSFSIPNPVRSEFFKTPRNLTPDKPLILFVGALVPLKRPMALLSVHRELRKQFPTLETVFCGEPESNSYYQELQRYATDGVRFVGRTGVEGLMGWFSRATTLVLPSAQENAPIVITEAMAAGMPVVASRVGGIPEMVEHGQTGFLYKADDVSSLSRWLKTLLLNPDLQMEMGHRARLKALNSYHPAQIARQTVHAYKMMLANETITFLAFG